MQNDLIKKIDEKIIQLYKSLSSEESQPISATSVDEAMRCIDDFDLKDSKSLFTIVAALNLVNAAIKRGNLNLKLHYSYIKTNVGKVADFFILNKDLFDNSSIYYDKKCKCLLFDIFNVVFSFHKVVETENILNVATNYPPIIWPGIRLQLIAQPIYEYANLLLSTESHNKCPSTTAKTSTLVPCPDCKNEISYSARSCPFCGSDLGLSHKMTEGIREGYMVKVSYNGLFSLGKVEKLDNHILLLILDEDKWIRLKISALDSIEVIDTNELSTELFNQQVCTFFEHFFELAGIEKESLIVTNSTITKNEKAGLMVICDNGENVICLKSGIIGYKKKVCTVGKRVFCGSIGSNGKCYNSIVEMSYGELIGFFQKAISSKQNMTQHRKTQVFAILNYLVKEASNRPEAYIEIKKFRKKVKVFFGQQNEEDDNFNNAELLPSENVDEDDAKGTNNDGIMQQQTIYKTESELITPRLKIVGKIDLDKISGSKKKFISDEISKVISTSLPSEKPTIISSKIVEEFLNKNLPNLSEARCKVLEKELDTLIRNGEKEECLKKSYEIIRTKRPTPKYFRSYLDRIVNTEIALDHINEAIQSLALLIAVTEHQSEANINSLGHLYLTMARLYLKEKNKEEALKSILYAENLRPDNNAIKKIKETILSLNADTQGNSFLDIDNERNESSNDISGVTMSKMLLQDVEFEANRLELLPSNKIVSAEQLFGKAQSNRNNQSENYEDKASSFLEAAAAYYNNKQTDTIMFKISIANYARFKGHGMFVRFSNLLKTNSATLSELQAFRDSACSYYIEALGIFNILKEKTYLQELFLKYLQLAIVVSNIEGGKTPAEDWENWTLNQIQLDCIKADSIEEKRIFFNTCISVGTVAEGAWNTLYNDRDGLVPFISRFGSQKFQKESYSLFNELAKASIPSDYAPGIFMHKIFEHRQISINTLKDYLEDCLKWSFSPFDIYNFENKWDSVTALNELMTTTDKKVMNLIVDIIEILKPYGSSTKENERTRILAQAQQVLIRAQKIVTNTATFYGRTFFSHLSSQWISRIAQLLDERDINTYPKLEITPDPCYIKKNDENEGVIDFLVTNNGDSSAQSFFVKALINCKEYIINYDKELPAGDCCSVGFASFDFLNKESIDVKFKLVAKYRGKDLPSIDTEAIYEIESGDILTDEIQIPWKISDTPKENIFKGREEKLSTLINHYLSKDRTQTYILYGLTRTGKSSILDYLCERIEGKCLHEDTNKKIMTFKWDFSKISFKNASVEDLWINLLEINIYNKLPNNIQDFIDSLYPENKLPESLRQLDLEIIVNALNSFGIVPLVTIDEFSNIRPMLQEGLVDATFVSELRNLALKGKACFVYAGTYDIKELPKEKDFGLEGQMTNTRSMHINDIEQVYADELIDACSSILFTRKAKAYIRALSGCVPYWIQWICLDCGKYAVAHKKRHLGYRDVDHVVRVLAGEEQPSKMDTWEVMDETNFHNNQITPDNVAEHQLISCISYLVRESTQIERGISMDELTRLWDNYNVPSNKRLNMTRALKNLEEKKVIRQFTDETREVYRLNVDLFRRWWYVHHRDLTLEFSL